MNREQLLKRWSELAPGECRGSGLRVAINGGTIYEVGGGNLPSYLVGAIDTAPIGRAVLLLALIEAIRVRGWHSVIWNDDKAFAHVKTADSELLGKAASHEPCDAILSAYVQALEVAR